MPATSSSGHARSRWGTRRSAALGLALAAGACNLRPTVIHPTFPDGGMLRDATPLPQAALAALEGFGDVGDGAGLFGAAFAARASPGRLSFFGPEDGAYAILEAGCLDGGATLVLEGAWRHAPDTDTGLVRLFVGPPETASALCAGSAVPGTDAPLTFTGTTGSGYALPGDPVAFTRSRPLAPMAGRFVSIAHHGTQTIEDYGASENTVEGCRLAEAMGAGAVELDVRLTRDGVPILFHDAGFTSRLTTGRFCQGDVADLTFAQIRANCRNKYGEKIYSLEEGLDGVMAETTLGGVWIDVKEPAAVAPALAVMAAADARAAAMGRTPWALVMGLAEQDLVDAYDAAKPPPGTRCLVEFDPDVALATGCVAWGPRFTEGPQPEAVKAAQARGLRVVFWTVDGDAFIQQFLGESQPDGMISDTPGLTFFYYQQQPFTPAGSATP